MKERVGVIVVHGIGEQKRGDHLEEVVRPLVEGSADDNGKLGRRVTVHAPRWMIDGKGPDRCRLAAGDRCRWSGGRCHP